MIREVSSEVISIKGKDQSSSQVAVVYELRLQLYRLQVIIANPVRTVHWEYKLRLKQNMIVIVLPA